MAARPLRIAILENDTPLDGTRGKYGGYGGVFSALLNSAAADLPGFSPDNLVLSIYDVVNKQEYPNLDDVDAILLSGSRHNSFDNDPWILRLVDFVKAALDSGRVRVIGVCYGHQIVARALGAKVGRSDKGWEISVTAVDLTKRGQEIFGRPALALHQMHKDIVYDYPEGVEALAYTDKCAVHGMYVAKKFITVQGHPEFNEGIVRELLIARHASGIFDDALYEDAMSRVDKYQDGIVVAKVFLKFALE